MAAQPSVLRLQVRLQPRASRNRLVSRQGGVIKVQVHAPPVAGAANAALIELLAATLGVPRGAVGIVHGETSRTKLVEVRSGDIAACQLRLEAALRTRVDKPEAGE